MKQSPYESLQVKYKLFYLHETLIYFFIQCVAVLYLLEKRICWCHDIR